MVLLVPELTFLTGLSDLRSNSRMLKEVMWEMIQSPQQHYQRLTSLLRRIRDTPDASRELERWGLRLDTDIYRTQGHVLPAERINLRHRSFLPAEELGWHREVTKEAPIAAVSSSLARLAELGWHLARELLAAARGSCGALGVRLAQPSLQELRDDRIESYVRSIRSALGSQDKVQLLLCIIPGGRDDVYGAIKKLCCVQTPVPSQVINAQSLTGHPGKIRSVVQKVLLQINCKLGGQLWGVDIPLVRQEKPPGKRPGMSLEALEGVNCCGHGLKQLESRGWLLLGARESLGAGGIRAWRCLVLSLNPAWLFFPLPEGAEGCGVKIKLLEFKTTVLGCKKSPVWGSERPEVVKMFILGCKRMKFGVFFSPPRQDFFLLAHHSRQGCSVPTRYICVWNTANLSSEHLQRLTFKLCHLYWNWPGTVRVPAPCKYAHKLAFLVGQVLHHEPSAHLSEQLFFL
ncbi:PIWL2 protein, partial [Edolisoma coerulescens]|nr:PIWL2 protein [Edolisoma coerulescens]